MNDFHAAIASRYGANTIILNCPDTEVWVLLLHHRPNICTSKIFLLTGSTGTYVDLNNFIPAHEPEITEAKQNILMHVYCLKGHDTCNSFLGIGKKSSYKVMMQVTIL